MAENGQKGVELFSNSGPGWFDAILMDIRMPVMDGLEATRAIRALPRDDAKNVPIIAMTANAYDTDVQQSQDAGMNEHLAKPIAPQTLYETLARNIEKNQGQ
ncbi:MAG: response regulator [Oscillospiraceae bacterium]|nr:response regulator [Oscillospiraceae bacterium]